MRFAVNGNSSVRDQRKRPWEHCVRIALDIATLAQSKTTISLQPNLSCAIMDGLGSYRREAGGATITDG